MLFPSKGLQNNIAYFLLVSPVNDYIANGSYCPPTHLHVKLFQT